MGVWLCYIVGIDSHMGKRYLGQVIVGVVLSSVVSLFVMPRLLLDPWSLCRGYSWVGLDEVVWRALLLLCSRGMILLSGNEFETFW